MDTHQNDDLPLVMNNWKRFIPLLHIFATLIAILFTRPVHAEDLQDTTRQAATFCTEATIHYHRRYADYEGWGLHVWGSTPLEGIITWDSPLEPAGEDAFGIYWNIEVNTDASQIEYIIHRGNEKDPGVDQSMIFTQVGCEIWQVQGRADQYSDPNKAIEALVVIIKPSESLGENQVIVHYRRLAADYEGWGLHAWGPTDETGVTWENPLKPDGQDDYGIYWVIDMQPSAQYLEYIIHKGDQKDPGPDQKLEFQQKGREIWLVQGSGEQFLDPESAKKGLQASILGDIKNKAQAHWLTRELIGWPSNFSNDAIYTLHYDLRGLLIVTSQGLRGGEQIPLEFIANTLSPELAEKYPHLVSSRLLKIPDEFLPSVPDILKGQYAIKATDSNGNVLGLTNLQIPGVLDDLYANDEPLGVVWSQGIPTIKVWAPTARAVRLVLFNESVILGQDLTPSQNPITSGLGRSYPMDWDPALGIWSITGEPGWRGKFYQYAVDVFVPQQGIFVTNFVTDPYSFSLSTNSTHTQIIDLQDPALSPVGWDDFKKPDLNDFTDSMLYELHLRDFSILDLSVPEEQRGTYMAFTHPESNGMQHLRWLSQQGITHIHLLPVFDFATINEDRTTWQPLDWELLKSFPPDSREQQSIINGIKDQDGYNWGYDPYHFTVPEGSYSVHPNGYIRTLEFRKMIKSLNEAGLRVVMDVVYNHTHAAGQNEQSTLDRIVPGYYHRLDLDGAITSSTCCPNTATEHAMMRKLMIDSLKTWATAYKVDGFRFDLMGHHMRDDILAVRDALDQLTLAKDGVDGNKIILYGEGWDFGEVANNARGVNATQVNMAGSKIGTFNDRLRDAVRGGNPFNSPMEQGFATGLFTDPNLATTLTESQQRAALFELKDQIRISLAGNLAEFPLDDFQGNAVTGKEITYNGTPAGYTHNPGDHIAYIAAHDNETLFDSIQYKLPIATTLEDRVRTQNLALSLVAFSQGIPFFHAGDEILRSKSLDRDSYDSSDWFNAIDWTLKEHNWGHGLPLQNNNGASWPIIQPLLANPDLAPSPEHLLSSRDVFGELLQIRSSSPLFSLKTADEIINQVHFHNTGPEQVPGLIVMSICDDPSTPVDPNYEVIFVLFNADPRSVTFKLAHWRSDSLELHPVQLNDPNASLANFDPNTQTFIVPGRSTIVFVGKERLVKFESAELKTELGTTQEFSETEKLDSHTTGQTESLTSEKQEQTPTTSGSKNWVWWIISGIVLIMSLSAYAFHLNWRKKSQPQ